MTFPCDTELRWAIGHFLVARTGRGNDDANRKQPQPAQGLEGLRRGGLALTAYSSTCFASVRRIPCAKTCAGLSHSEESFPHR